MSKLLYVYQFLKIVEPSTKSKYKPWIDSELVLWRKGEKVYISNVLSIEIKTEISNLQSVRAFLGDSVPFA